MKIRQNEKKRAKFRVSFLFLFIFASFVVCFVFYMKEDFEISSDMVEIEDKEVVRIEPIGDGITIVNPVPAGAKADKSYYDDAVFIGNTVLAGLSDNGYVSPSNMLLSDSITLSNFNTVFLSVNNEEISIADAALGLNAGKIYIMVGVDDLEGPFGELEDFIDTIKEKSNKTQIYLMSLLPVTSDNESRIALNSDIDTYNSRLLDLADQKDVFYIDVSTDFKGNDGKLPPSYAEVNGVRLKKESYDRLSDYILTHTG